MMDDTQPPASDEESSGKEETFRVIHPRILVPPRRKDLLRRPRLLDFIHEHSTRKLILISAAAGYGKTSLLVDYAHDTPLPVCWYSVAESDDDPRIFLEYLVASVAHRFPQILEGNLEPLLGRAAKFDRQAVIGALITGVQRRIPEPFVLILDDYHRIGESSPVNSLLDTFLQQQPTNVTVILSSRTLPNISLLRLTARREVAGLGTGDLRFTAEEIREFLRLGHNLSITVEQANKLARESEGWITAIVLGMHTLWKGLLQTMIRARAKGAYVYDYMAQEVFNCQEEEVQDFLKRTSVLTSMNAEFCDKLLERTDSADMLELVEQRNLFLSKIPGIPTSYRYHDLFRKFLIDQLHTEQPDVFKQLHHEAATLYVETKEWNEAVDHFVAAGDYDAAAEVVEDRGWAMAISGKLGTLASWLESLPEQVRAGRSSLLLLQGRLYMERKKFQEAERSYERAENLARAEPDCHQLAQILVEEAAVLQEKGEYERALHKCNQVTELVSAASLEDKLIARVHRISGQCLEAAESLSSAEEELEKALEIYEREEDLFFTANVLQDLGTLQRRKGNAQRGEELYLRALFLFEKTGNIGRVAEVQNNIAVGYHYQGDYVKALETFRKAIANANEGMNPRAKAAILTGMADIYRELGQPARAIDLYSEALQIAQSIPEGFLLVYSRAMLGETHSLEGEFEMARQQLADAEEVAGQEGAEYALGLVRIGRGISERWRGDLNSSAQYLRSACDLLEAFGAQRELARARLHLAYTLFEAGHRAEADDQLGLAIKLSEEAGYHQLLLADGRMMMPFLRKSLARHMGRPLAREWLKRIEGFPSAQTLEAFGIVEEVVPRLPHLEIRAFGQEHVLLDGKKAPQTAWGGPLVRELFFYILDQGPVTLDEIGLVFWPDYSPAKVKSVFHSTMYRLRRLIAPELVIYDDESARYLFNRDHDYFYDVEEFEKASDMALREESSEEEIMRNGNKAIELYRGEFLGDSSLIWCLHRREKLRQTLVHVVMRLVALHREKGNLGQSIWLYHRAIEEDPFLERAHRGLMRCYALQGERSKAIKHYLDYSQYLMEELDMAPSDETMNLYYAILNRKFNKDQLKITEP